MPAAAVIKAVQRAVDAAVVGAAVVVVVVAVAGVALETQVLQMRGF